MTLMIIGAVWGLLLATRLLRGEEDAGRAELLLLGRTTRQGATAETIAGLGAGAVVLFVITAASLVLVGRDRSIGFAIGASLFFAAALVACAVMFLAVGVVTSQIAATRRQASSLAGVVLGVAYALRMVADSSVSLEWLRWLSPLGWIEQLSPLVAPAPFAYVPIVTFTVVLCALAVILSGRRDVGSGLRADRADAPARLRLLRSSLGLSTRLVRGTVLGWWSAIVVSALLMGYVARAAGEVIAGSSIAQVLDRFGARGSGAATYLGLASLILAVLVAFLAASQVAALRGEEAQGRLEPLMTRPVGRLRWLAGRLGVAGAAVLLAGVLAGVGTWIGTVFQGGGFSLGTLLAAGINTVAPALCVLGLATAAVGVLPRYATKIAWGIVAWSLLVELVGGIGAVSSALVATSVFHHMAAAPAVPPDWRSAGGLVAVGLAGVAIGAVGFVRRDLSGS